MDQRWAVAVASALASGNERLRDALLAAAAAKVGESRCSTMRAPPRR
jgi:hypothetical protein